MPRQVQPCGTAAAYQRHMRRAEVPCEECVVAWAEHNAAYKRANRDRINAQRREHTANGPHELAPHGTHAGYARHRYNLQQPCYSCRLAEAAYQSDRRAKRLEAAR